MKSDCSWKEIKQKATNILPIAPLWVLPIVPSPGQGPVSWGRNRTQWQRPNHVETFDFLYMFHPTEPRPPQTSALKSYYIIRSPAEFQSGGQGQGQ